MTVYKSEKGQAMPGPVQPILPENFEPIGHTELRWLGGGGVMLNCRAQMTAFEWSVLLRPCIVRPVLWIAVIGNLKIC